MKELDRRRGDLPDGAERDVICQRRKEEKCVLNAITVLGILLSVFTIFSLMFSVSVVHYGLSYFDAPFGVRRQQYDFELDFEPDFEPLAIIESEELLDERAQRVSAHLLSPGFDNKSCISRDESRSYRKYPTWNPSSYLISKIQSYESLHKRCGPHTKSYRKALDKLSPGKQSGPTDCNYLVWKSYGALENRILALTSAFLYALVTDRVLLVDRGKDITDLFCEPFPETSWLLPIDFPLMSQFDQFNPKSYQSYRSMLKRQGYENISDKPIPSALYVHLGSNDHDDQDKLFFRDHEQSFLEKVPWLIMKTDNYFIPSLLLIPSFGQEISNLFPEKEAVFHFLGRHLLHPANDIWDLITRDHHQFLSSGYERIGIQIKVFDYGDVLKQQVLDQILSCVWKEGLLPGITKQTYNTKTYMTKSVMVASLDSWYFEQLSGIYWESPTTTGDDVIFFSPFRVESQQTDLMQNQKAWAEMYLLSLTDKLVTSSWSTFGFVAQGLGGLRPWILYEPENQKAPSPPCQQAMSMEQCYHTPPFDGCKKKAGADSGLLVLHDAL